MTIYVTEHGQSQRLRGSGVNLTPLRGYILSSAASTGFAAGCEYIRVSADVGSIVAITTSTAQVAGSSNGFRIPANGPAELFAVSTGRFLIGAST
jgi:hypothetical protein